MSIRLTGIAFLLVTFSCVASAGSVDVSSSEFVTIAQGATVEFGFNVSNFARNSGSYNPYPTALNFQILGQAAAGQPSANLPGSSQQYDPQFLLDAMLTSADGSTSVPLVESAANRLGLKSGSMVVTNGVYESSQNTSVNMITAGVQLSAQQSALIFGPNIASASDMAYVVLHNDGPALLLGIGSGYNLTSAFVVSGVTGSAPVSTGGVTEQVYYSEAVSAAPEPVTYVNLLGGFAILAMITFFRWKKSKRVAA